MRRCQTLPPHPTKPAELELRFHLQPVQDPCKGGYMREAVALLEAHYGAVFWQDLCIMNSPCWSTFLGRTCDPVGDPHWSEELQLIARIHGGKFVEDYLPWDRSHAGARCFACDSNWWVISPCACLNPPDFSLSP